MDKEKLFVDGMMFKNPIDSAPKWIKGNILVNVDKFREFCIKNAGYVSEKGWLNIDLKEGRTGAMYLELNTWKPQKQVVEPTTKTSPSEDHPEGLDIDKIPF